MPKAKRDFYRYHASLMEPWDGPASIAFTDGTVVGAVLDRNGLRPSRYWVTSDDLVIMASEVGVIDVEPAKVLRKGRLQPGRMFLVDTHEGRIIGDEEVKQRLADAHPYGDWMNTNQVALDSLPSRPHTLRPHQSVVQRQQVFGYTTEELKIILDPLARTGAEPLGVDGHRHTHRRAVAPLAACCSTTSRSCSPRSPTLRSTPSARSWSPPSAAPSGPRATCSTRSPGRAGRSTCPVR